MLVILSCPGPLSLLCDVACVMGGETSFFFAVLLLYIHMPRRNHILDLYVHCTTALNFSERVAPTISRQWCETLKYDDVILPYYYYIPYYFFIVVLLLKSMNNSGQRGLVISHQHGFECIALPEFVNRFKKRSKECIHNIYQTQRPIEAIGESNRLITTLPSDIFTIVAYDTIVMSEYQRTHSNFLTSTDAGCRLAIHLASYLIRCMIRIHNRYRNTFYDSLERCCAVANDFLRMMALLNDWLDEFIDTHNLDSVPNRPSFLSLQAQRQDLLSVYLRDAVYSAEIAHSFVMDPVHTDLSKIIYTTEWEDQSEPYTVATSIIKTLQDYLQDVRLFLESSFLFHKFIDALMSAIVTFLVQQLLVKAKQIRRFILMPQKKSVASSSYVVHFHNPHRAAQRFVHDITAIRSYFETLAELIPSLETSIQRHFHPLDSICVFINIITSWQPHTPIPADDVQKISHVLHRIFGRVTGKFMKDLTFLFTLKNKISSKRARQVYENVEKNLVQLQLFETVEHYSYFSFIDDNLEVLPPVLRVDQFLTSFYDQRASGLCSV